MRVRKALQEAIEKVREVRDHHSQTGDLIDQEDVHDLAEEGLGMVFDLLRASKLRPARKAVLLTLLHRIEGLVGVDKKEEASALSISRMEDK